MDDLKLRIGGADYDHTRALFDGSVPIEGVAAEFETSALVSDTFQHMVQGELDVAELGLTYFLRTFDLEDAPFTALPIFPLRVFRHSAIFVNTASGIRTPRDLVGKTIGEFGLYGHDAGVWPKGILADEYGVTPDQCRWVIGGTNHPIPSFTWIPQPVPAGVDVRHAADDQTLGAMLEAGDIDALISVDVPQAVLDGSPRVARLFPAYETVERDYYRRTGIFPIHHLVAVRKDLARQPGLMQAIYRAYSASKDVATERYRAGALKQHVTVMVPWFSELFEENRRLLSEDWWPYGVDANRATVDTLLRYHHEQGLSRRLLTCDDIFVPELLAS